MKFGEGVQSLMTNKTYFIMGYPFAGKTTFIAALWHSIQQKRTSTKLKLKNYAGDLSYLAALEKDWLAGKEVGRTLLTSQNESLLLTLKDDLENEINLSFPDFSGELFNNIYIDREISIELKERICSSDAFVLFLNPKSIYEPVNISEIPGEIRQETASSKKDIKYDKIEHDSSAAKLIELLQIVSYLFKDKSINLSVIISAWDCVESDTKTPVGYLKECLPMFLQYLKSNTGVFNVRYYGVSAQGAELNDRTLSAEKNAENVEHLLEQYEINPVERIQVVDEHGNITHDITLPFADLMNGE